MNIQEELVLKILESVDVIQGKTKFVKILHLTCKLLEDNNVESPFDFKADQFGVNTQQLEPVLLRLQTNEMIKVSKPALSRRFDLSLVARNYSFVNEAILGISPRIESLVQELNQHSSDDVIAMSYYLFPETTTESKIKPKMNKKITEMFSSLSTDFEESFEEEKDDNPKSIHSEVTTLYPQFNDLDVRMHMMKSLGLAKLPDVTPDVVDESSGLIAKKHPFFKKYNLEKMLEDDRRS